MGEMKDPATQAIPTKLHSYLMEKTDLDPILVMSEKIVEAKWQVTPWPAKLFITATPMHTQDEFLISFEERAYHVESLFAPDSPC